MEKLARTADTQDSASRGKGSLTRRGFLGATMSGGAALIGGSLAAFGHAELAGATSNDAWVEKSILELHALMACGRLTSRQLTLGYLHRIADLNPLLHAVIETNPEALGDRGQAGR